MFQSGCAGFLGRGQKWEGVRVNIYITTAENFLTERNYLTYRTVCGNTVLYDSKVRKWGDGTGDIQDRGGGMGKVREVGEGEGWVSLESFADAGGGAVEAGGEVGKREYTTMEDYPMLPSNPCRLMADEEFSAYIRKRREEFGPKWEKYMREIARSGK